MLFLHSNGLGTARAVRVYQSSALMPFGSFSGTPMIAFVVPADRPQTLSLIEVRRHRREHEKHELHQIAAGPGRSNSEQFGLRALACTAPLVQSIRLHRAVRCEPDFLDQDKVPGMPSHFLLTGRQRDNPAQRWAGACGVRLLGRADLSRSLPACQAMRLSRLSAMLHLPSDGRHSK
jgi:hypothetical protein